MRGFVLPYNNTKKIYSFDLFDTLVCRSVKQPKDVFKLIERFSNIEYRSTIFSKVGFYKLRVLAEILARKISFEEEVRLDQIYHILSNFIVNFEEAKLSEINCEISVLFPINKNVEILKDLLKNNEKCCITSDMYLPKSVITRIIKEKLNIDNIDIFVSSDLMKTKHTGSLYKIIRDYYKIQYSDITHHGDNIHSDINIAKQLGINTILVENNNTLNRDKSFFRMLKPIQPNRVHNIFYELGFYMAGPCVWVTNKWMAKDLKDNGIEKIFFGARDGYLFNLCFNKVSDIKTQYFRVSRRALFLPIFAIDMNHTYLLFERGESLTAKDFFERLDCDCPQHLESIKPYYHQELFLKELEIQGFRERCEEELKNFNLYLKSINFNGKLAFFDLGWRGSLQNVLEEITNSQADIHGYYFGLTEKVVKNSKRKAYYFYSRRNKVRKLMLLQSLAFFEFLFTEPEQSLKRVHINEDNEFEFEFIENIESQNQIQMRKNIMEGAKDFFCIIEPIDKIFSLQVSDYSRDLDQQIKSYINYPSKKLVDAFTEITHSAAFGGTHTRNIIEETKFSVESYRNSFWRSGYISSLTGLEKFVGKSVHICFYNLGGLKILNMKKKIANKIKSRKS